MHLNRKIESIWKLLKDDKEIVYATIFKDLWPIPEFHWFFRSKPEFNEFMEKLKTEIELSNIELIPLPKEEISIDWKPKTCRECNLSDPIMLEGKPSIKVKTNEANRGIIIRDCDFGFCIFTCGYPLNPNGLDIPDFTFLEDKKLEKIKKLKSKLETERQELYDLHDLGNKYRGKFQHFEEYSER